MRYYLVGDTPACGAHVHQAILQEQSDGSAAPLVTHQEGEACSVHNGVRKARRVSADEPSLLERLERKLAAQNGVTRGDS